MAFITIFNKITEIIRNKIIIGNYSIRIKKNNVFVGYVKNIKNTSCGYKYEKTMFIEKALSYKSYKRCMINIENITNNRYILNDKDHIFEIYEITSSVLRKEKLKKIIFKQK